MVDWGDTFCYCVAVSLLMRFGRNDKLPTVLKPCSSGGSVVRLRGTSSFMSRFTNDSSPADITGVLDRNFKGLEGSKFLVHLDDATYNPYMAQNKWTLVMYYCSECGISSDARPHFAKAAEVLWKEGRGDIRLATVDCDRSKKTCTDARITSYPIFQMYYGKIFVEQYSSTRDVENFAKYGRNPPKKWYILPYSFF